MHRASCSLFALALVGCGPPPAAPSAPEPPPAAPTAEPVPPSPAVTIVAQSEPELEPRTAEPAPPPTPQGSGCSVPPAPERSAGSLVVPSPPAKPARAYAGRLRAHVDGALSLQAKRTWVGPPVPAFVPLTSGTLELFLLDPLPDGFFALYRDPYGASSCKLAGNANCAFEVAAFDCSGRTRFRIPLKAHLSRRDELEVQDARMLDGVVYFNEACQSYSRQAGGRCSSLVALDPVKKKVLWRTPALTSNNRFLVYDRYLVTGYGFTAEPDFLFLVRRSDGKVLEKHALPSAHEELIDGENTVVAQIEAGKGLLFKRVGFDGATGRLEAAGWVEKPAP